VHWRQGTQKGLSARFALRRVIAAGVPQREQEPLGLLIEWRDDEPEPANFFLVSLPGLRTKKQLIRLVMQRKKAAASPAGITPFRWLCAATRSSLPNARGVSPSARGAVEAHAQPLQA
jgi:hypothetical protein